MSMDFWIGAWCGITASFFVLTAVALVMATRKGK